MKKNLSAITLAALAATSHAAGQDDPHLWLEDIAGEKTLEWVKSRNQTAEQQLMTADSAKMQADIMGVLTAQGKIPYVSKRGNYYYNFWTDAQHQQGLWRRTTPAEYRKPNPKWEVLLDIDALNRQEKENWVWHGADCLKPDYSRCLVSLSRGGADADVTREFDLNSKKFVENGFYRPEAKGSLGWIDRDHVFVSTDFGAGSLTDSGYPREVRIWTRGTPMASAQKIFAAGQKDMSASAARDHAKGFERDFVYRTVDFYNDELYLLDQGRLKKIEDVPNSVKKGVVRRYLTLSPREDWTLNGKTYKAGSYLVADFDAWMRGKRDITVLFEPDAHTSLNAAVWIKNHVVLNLLHDVKNRIVVLDERKQWKQGGIKDLPDNSKIYAYAVDEDNSDQVWLTVGGYTQPDTLYLADAAGPSEKLKSAPAFFPAADYTATQYFAVSKDGTRVPYFVVAHKNLKADGKNPTLLYGYGGFEVSMPPHYSGTVGRAWLERTDQTGRHGVYVVANIRGGGEYGPAWHRAALKENRHKSYEDFAAVARDLAARKITSPEHLGAQGGSNGGLLMGNMITQYPELFGAVVVQVPLLDMQRYSKLLAGASWMAEYGDPDKPEEWAYIRTFSPYHLFDPAKKYPPVLFTTSTRDDRVHPGHARKMMAKMEAAGKDVLYYENTEGGHGGAANSKQQAHMNTLAYAFLWQKLGNRK
ncbi:TPA: prolyl oligopeptidase family protein [Neisseria bacilliformis]